MVATYKCDHCGYTMKPHEGKRLALEYNGILIEVISGWKGTWNAGDICHRCAGRSGDR
jgi:hypothetical protein